MAMRTKAKNHPGQLANALVEFEDKLTAHNRAVQFVLHSLSGLLLREQTESARTVDGATECVLRLIDEIAVLERELKRIRRRSTPRQCRG